MPKYPNQSEVHRWFTVKCKIPNTVLKQKVEYQFLTSFNFVKENRKYIRKTANTLLLSNPSILTTKWTLLQCIGNENIQTVSIKILQLSIKVEKITSYCYDNQQEDL